MLSKTHDTVAASLPPATPTASGARRLSALYEVSKILSGAQDLNTTLREVLTVVAAYVELRRVTVALRDRSGKVYVAGSTDPSLEAGRTAANAYPLEAAQDVLRANMPAIMAVTRDDPRCARYCEHIAGGEEHRVTFICVPVRLAGGPIGTLSAERVNDGGVAPFDDDLSFLRMIGNLVAQALRLHGFPGTQTAGDRRAQLAERPEAARPTRSRNRTPQPGEFGEIVGESPAMTGVLEQVRHVARTRAPVMLRGESGTGKEMIAQLIHRFSPRRDKPMICVNCAALPENLLESELFGHDKGAFTGANSERKGRFEAAHGGTLFLDEIGDIPHTFQTKLLRVLQEGQFERLGSSRTRSVDVRIIAATNRNLEQAVVDGDFRADLYYRINVVSIIIPPLRQRVEDIAPLAEHFLARFNQENGDDLGFAQEALDTLERCPFPGNVRELENCITRVATMARGERIQAWDFPCGTNGCLASALWPDSAAHPHGGETPAIPSHPAPPAVREAGDTSGSESADSSGGRLIERTRLVTAMEKAGWVQAKAARLLGMTPRQVRYALHKHGIEVKRL
ncbi:nif-specific transcriptional activator NifA [Rhodovibrio salinarum]|uniref:Nif-specific regulatory protein n=1 Tax=Rhodovibrio salinarum TaxID=1087 RepID=A0A934QLN5_9PROT|nr:nif-specific transcriptional activator NifA [Rhodovibrio salinarum]MBK1699002.1 nif-specific transcriptional activator NifA [Rhodovibrio salinarum]